MEDLSEYSHSPVHVAVIRREHDTLRQIISSLPIQPNADEITTEDESIAAELQSNATSAVIDRRDVPSRETPLHLSVRLKDPISTEILMVAGADWSLQNQSGWNPLQEAVCRKEEEIIKIIARHLHPQAIAKWHCRLPRVVASTARVRDFYTEIEFHFESLVIPFISRIAPSDSFKIWKIGSNLRVDLTLVGFDGFRCKRRDHSYLFLGEERCKQVPLLLSPNNMLDLPRGAVIVLDHGKKEIRDALEGPTEDELEEQVERIRKALRYRPGIDITKAELAKSLDWRGRERTEMVGEWQAKVYDMFPVMLSVRSKGTVVEDDVADAIDRLANGADNNDKKKKKKKKRGSGEMKSESEYKKGLKPCLWLTSDFPLETEELLPLLDILADKVKVVRRLRELLATKLPSGTLPVKLVIPIIPTVRVVTKFTKFEELKPVKEFSTPPSSPTQSKESARCNESDGSTSWMRGIQSSDGGKSRSFRDKNDPFHIPSDYAWIDADEKQRRIQAEKG